MSKYKIKTLALLSAIPFLFTACSLQDLPLIGSRLGPKSSGPVELTMWGLWESSNVINSVFEEYKKLSPQASLKYEDMSSLKLEHLVEYKKRVFTRLEQSSWEADVVLVHNSWVPRLVKSGFIQEVPQDIMTPQQYTETFYPVATDDAVINSKLYAIPAYYDGLVMVYNKKHFDEIGLQNPPTAWEEFRRVAIDLTVMSDEGNRSQVIRGGAAIGGTGNIENFSDILGLMWSQAGVKIPDSLDSVPAQDALSFYLSLMNDHKIWKPEFPEATTAFVNGQVSMIFVPSWKILDILKAAPSLEIGVAPVPQALANNPVTWASYWMYVVPKNSDASAEAWKYIQFLSSEEGERLMYAKASEERPFGTPYARKSLASSLENHEYLGPIIKSAPYARSAEIAGRSGNRLQEDELMKAIDLILTENAKEKLSIADALKRAKEAIAL